MIPRVIKAIRQNIVAWLALFVALSGTSMAASHYIITSTKQIKPSVLKQLRGAHGAAGAKGATGATGAAGAQGPQGSSGNGGATGPGGAKGEKGPTGKPGEPGEAGEPGTPGEQGLPGTALAYAYVNATASEIKATEKGAAAPNIKVTQATEGTPTGIYCISGLGFEAHNVVGTIDYEETAPNTSPVLTATLGIGTGSGCPAGTQITVETSEEKGKLVDEGFYVVIN